VPEADGDSVTIQSLVNQIRDWEDEQVNLAYDRILMASGKEDLGGSIVVGITATLENAKLKFEARGSPTTCKVFGGNLVAVDANGDAMFVIDPSYNVTVMLAQSSSATMVQDADIDTILARIGVPGSTIALDLEDIDAKVVSLPGSLSTTHGDGSWEGAIE